VEGSKNVNKKKKIWEVVSTPESIKIKILLDLEEPNNIIECGFLNNLIFFCNN